MESHKMLFFTVLLSFLPSVYTQDNYTNITIGAILNSDYDEQIFRQAVSELHAPPGYRYVGETLRIPQNPVQAALEICQKMLPKQPVSVVFQTEPALEQLMTAVPFTFEFYKIPVVGINSRSSVLSNSYTHPHYLRTMPPYSYQAGIWYDTLEVFKYDKVIFVYVDDIEGGSTLNTFRQHLLESPTIYGEQNLEIQLLVELKSYESNYTAALKQILAVDARVVLLSASTKQAYDVFNAARKLDMVGQNWVWIVSEQASKADNVPQGILSWHADKSVMTSDKHIKDAVTTIGMAVRTYLTKHNASLDDIPSDCSVAVNGPPDDVTLFGGRKAWWQPGVELLGLMLNQTFKGETGPVQYLENGDRRSINCQLLNVINTTNEHLNFSNVGEIILNSNYTTTGVQSVYENISMNVSAIIWPGNLSTKPMGIDVAKHLRVVTIEELPYIYSVPFNPAHEECNSSQLHEPQAKMRCPKTFPNGTRVEYCCHGYLIDMLDMLSINMSLSFSLHLVSDGEYGAQFSQSAGDDTTQRVANNSGKTEWNGMMGELLDERADMIAAPFVITPERAKYVDFTKPFQFLGITILVKKSIKESNLSSFLQPFEDPLWYLVTMSVFVIALVLYLLDRFSPFGQLQLARDADAEDSLTLSTAIWFSWGVLLNSGLAEGTPKSFSGRVLGMIWAGFSMIIVASYTANLAAFLVLDRPEASISGIDDPRLRNPTDGFLFATVQNSAIETYFKRQVEYTTMYRTMENQNKASVEEAIQAVEDKKLHAFIWDSPRLQYEATRKCDLITAGELFGRSSYGIAFRKNSVWTESFSLKILSYHEVGQMERYDNTWIMQKAANCDGEETSPATLGLTNMAGVFIMVGIGIVCGFVILLIEIGYSRYEQMKEQQNTIAKRSVAKWQRFVKRRKALRKTRALIKSSSIDSPGLLCAGDQAMLREFLRQQTENQNKNTNHAADNDMETAYTNNVEIINENGNPNANQTSPYNRKVSSNEKLSELHDDADGISRL